jgi:hypothetical protein
VFSAALAVEAIRLFLSWLGRFPRVSAVQKCVKVNSCGQAVGMMR